MSEVDITWSSIEKYVPYNKVIWNVSKEGIPRYAFFDKNYRKIDVDFNELLVK
jgi:hypothetical protein